MIRKNDILLSNNNIVNLADYNNEIIEIDSTISEITITSKNEVVNVAIIISKRDKDLILNIKDLRINSKKQIAIDFRSGNISNYKSKLIYKGSNIIESEDNIGICISNNQKVEIIGDKKSKLQILGGLESPGIGSNEYTSGSGHLIFSQSGYIEIKGGNGSNINDTTYRGRTGSCGIKFEQGEEARYSTIKILDNVNIKVIGGNGEDICTITSDKIAGNGGDAINIGENCIIEKNGIGLLELIGGDGGGSIGDYSCGKCGDGGQAINICSGLILIKSPASLIGGNAGGIDLKYKNSFSKGGHGGSCISILNEKNKDKHTKIRLYNNIQAKGGLGGNSGICLENNNTIGITGGDGGSFINAQDFNTNIIIGKINFVKGNPGQGGRGQIIGKVGNLGVELKGSKITVTEINDEIINYENIKVQTSREFKIVAENFEILKDDINIEVNNNIKENGGFKNSYNDGIRDIEEGVVEGISYKSKRSFFVEKLYKYIMKLFNI